MIRRRLHDPACALDYPALSEFKSDGGTDYAAMPMICSSGEINSITWLTDRAGGFSDDEVAGLASVLWILYAGYEALMKLRVLCSGECNIRVDLLVLYPALFLVSLAAIVEFLLRRKRDADGPT